MIILNQDSEQLMTTANTVKEVLLYGLEREGYLVQGTAKDIGEKYAIVIHQRGWLGKLWDKHFEKIEGDGLRVSLIKIV